MNKTYIGLVMEFESNEIKLSDCCEKYFGLSYRQAIDHNGYDALRRIVAAVVCPITELVCAEYVLVWRVLECPCGRIREANVAECRLRRDGVRQRVAVRVLSIQHSIQHFVDVGFLGNVERDRNAGRWWWTYSSSGAASSTSR